MNNRSVAFFRAANIIALDYPYQAAIESALRVVDYAMIMVAPSIDGTEDIIYKLSKHFGRDHLVIVYGAFVYDRGWQERWWSECDARVDNDWRLWLDLDEVIPPAAAPWLREQMQEPSVSLIRFPFTHFYATPDYTGGFSLMRNTRLGRASVGYRMVNMCSDEHPDWSACAMRYGDDGRDAHAARGPIIADCPWSILHYGWCRDATALAMSQAKHHAWYADGDGLEDGRLPMARPYPFRLAEHLVDGWAKPYDKPHPPEMTDWFDRHSEQWRQLAEALPA